MDVLNGGLVTARWPALFFLASLACTGTTEGGAADADLAVDAAAPEDAGQATDSGTVLEAGRTNDAQIPTDAGPLPSDVLFYDGFESGDFSHTQNGVEFLYLRNTENGSGVTTEVARTGAHAVKIVFEPIEAYNPGVNSGRRGSKLEYALNRYVHDLWVQYDAYHPSEWDNVYTDAFAHNKGPLHAWEDDYSNFALQKMWFESWWNPGAQAGSVSTAGRTGGSSTGHHVPTVDGQPALWPDMEHDLGAWRRITIRVRAPQSSSEMGIFQVWKDGVLILDQERNQWQPESPNHAFNHIYIFGPTGAGHAERVSVYVDNLIISANPLL